MKLVVRCLLLSFASILMATSASFAETKLPSGLTVDLLEGYTHKPLQGIDSLVGKIAKKDGPVITYEIGHNPKPGAPRFGGSFSNRVEALPTGTTLWRKKQVGKDRTLYVAHQADGMLLVSIPLGEIGINLSSKVEKPEEIAEILLMAASLRKGN